jgi:hypothetical protein
MQAYSDDGYDRADDRAILEGPARLSTAGSLEQVAL